MANGARRRLAGFGLGRNRHGRCGRDRHLHARRRRRIGPTLRPDLHRDGKDGVGELRPEVATPTSYGVVSLVAFVVVVRYVKDELRRCTDEIKRLRALPHKGVTVRTAIGLSAIAACFGNAVVIADRLTHSQWPTGVGVPVIGLTGAVLLARRGWSRHELGFRTLGIDRPALIVKGLLALAAVVVVICAVVGLARGRHGTPATMARLLIATVGGEELVHRGVLLGVWLSTPVRARSVLMATMATFGLWHIAVATHDGSFHVLEVIIPVLGAAVLLWVRLRARSLLGPVAFHAGSNMPKFL